MLFLSIAVVWRLVSLYIAHYQLQERKSITRARPSGGSMDFSQFSRLEQGPRLQKDNQTTYRMLCLDGGGVRGMFTARLLYNLSRECPGWLDSIDCIAGSSTGGLIALLIAMGYQPDAIVKIYKETCPRIFPKTIRRYLPFLARYSSSGKERVFRAIVQDETLGNLRHNVIITAYCMDAVGGTRGLFPTFYHNIGWRPALFTNLPKGSGRVEPDDDLLVRDAAMRTTAAPTYFPIHQGYCDGAVFANNPSLCALSRAMMSTPRPLENIVVFSIGTGSADHRVKGRFHDWGLWQWASLLVDLLFDSSEGSVDMNMRMLLGDKYMRLNSVLPNRVELDDVSALDELMALADAVDLSEAVVFIRTRIMHSRTRTASMPNMGSRTNVFKDLASRAVAQSQRPSAHTVTSET